MSDKRFCGKCGSACDEREEPVGGLSLYPRYDLHTGEKRTYTHYRCPRKPKIDLPPFWGGHEEYRIANFDDGNSIW